jgi:hypothetical protein
MTSPIDIVRRFYVAYQEQDVEEIAVQGERIVRIRVYFGGPLD